MRECSLMQRLAPKRLRAVNEGVAYVAAFASQRNIDVVMWFWQSHRTSALRADIDFHDSNFGVKEPSFIFLHWTASTSGHVFDAFVHVPFRNDPAPCRDRSPICGR